MGKGNGGAEASTKGFCEDGEVAGSRKEKGITKSSNLQEGKRKSRKP